MSAMDTRARYHRLFAHDAWANREVIAHLRSLDTPPPRAVAVMAHVGATGFLWLGRLGFTDERVPVWPSTGLEASAVHCDGVAALWHAFVDGLDDEGLARTIRYTNSQGKGFTSRADDVIEHVLQHGAYHRGQVATILRSAGLEPPYTDLIHSTRNGLLG